MRPARAAAAALVFLSCACVGYAQTYPAKQIRIVVAFAPGGGTDILTRIMVPKLNELLKQQLIVDNRPGAGSRIGTELVAKAPADGYTVLMVDTAFMTNPSLYSKLPYESERDFAPVSLSATLVKIVGEKDTQSFLAAHGLEPAASTLDELGRIVRDEIPKFADIVKTAGIKPQ